jgi:hypothetical protein
MSQILNESVETQRIDAGASPDNVVLTSHSLVGQGKLFSSISVQATGLNADNESLEAGASAPVALTSALEVSNDGENFSSAVVVDEGDDGAVQSYSTPVAAFRINMTELEFDSDVEDLIEAQEAYDAALAANNSAYEEYYTAIRAEKAERLNHATLTARKATVDLQLSATPNDAVAAAQLIESDGVKPTEDHDAAQALTDAAQDDFDAQEIVRDGAQGDVDDAEGVVATKEGVVATKEGVVATKQAIVDPLQVVLDDANGAYDVGVGVVADAQAVVDAAQIVFDAAEEAASVTVDNGGFEFPGDGGADTLDRWIEAPGAGATITRDATGGINESAAAKFAIGADGEVVSAITHSDNLINETDYTYYLKAKGLTGNILEIYNGTTLVGTHVLTTDFASYSSTFTTDGQLTFKIATKSHADNDNAIIFVDDVIVHDTAISDALDDATTDLSDAEDGLSDATDALALLATAVVDAETALVTPLAELATALSELATAEGELDTAEGVLAAAEAVLTTEQDALDVFDALLTEAIANQAIAEITYTLFNQVVTRFTTASSALASLISTSASAITTKTNTVATKKAVITTPDTGTAAVLVAKAALLATAQTAYNAAKLLVGVKVRFTINANIEG